MSTIFVILTIVALGGVIGYKPVHNYLRRIPALGVFIFLLLNIVMITAWRGVWQFWPIYFVLAILAVEYLFLTLFRQKKMQVTVKFNKKLYLICAYITLCSLAVFPIVKTVGVLDRGQIVGTWKMTVESTDRLETLVQDSEDKRRFTVQMYYPVHDKKGERKKWFEGGSPSVKGLALSYGVPEVMIGHLKSVKSSAYLTRKIQATDHPYQVVLISHGFKSSSDQYTRLAETLASKGYFVAVVNHPYSAYATVYGKKEYVLGARSSLGQIDLMDEKIELERKMTLIQKEDLKETFRALESLNAGEIDENFKEKLDLTDLTLVGHQIGGGAVLIALEEMPSAKTGVLLNPVLEQIPKKYILAGSTKGVLALVSSDYKASNNAMYLGRFLSASREGLLFATTSGKDMDMTDLGLVSNLFALKGLSEGRKANEKTIRAQVDIVDHAIQKYSQGQIFEKLSENIDQGKLGLNILSPEQLKQ